MSKRAGAGWTAPSRADRSPDREKSVLDALRWNLMQADHLGPHKALKNGREMMPDELRLCPDYAVQKP